MVLTPMLQEIANMPSQDMKMANTNQKEKPVGFKELLEDISKDEKV